MLDHVWLSHPKAGARHRLSSAALMVIVAMSALIASFAGIALSVEPAQAQDTPPVTIHKRASVEEAEVDQTYRDREAFREGYITELPDLSVYDDDDHEKQGDDDE